MGREGGALHFYLDNIRIRRGDGSVVGVWRGAKDTRYRKPKPVQRFADISVRAVGVPGAEQVSPRAGGAARRRVSLRPPC